MIKDEDIAIIIELAKNSKDKKVKKLLEKCETIQKMINLNSEIQKIQEKLKNM